MIETKDIQRIQLKEIINNTTQETIKSIVNALNAKTITLDNIGFYRDKDNTDSIYCTLIRTFRMDKKTRERRLMISEYWNEKIIENRAIWPITSSTKSQ